MPYTDVEFVTATSLDAADLNQLDENVSILEPNARYANVADLDYVWKVQAGLDDGVAGVPAVKDGTKVWFDVDIGGHVQFQTVVREFGEGAGQTPWGWPGWRSASNQLQKKNVALTDLPTGVLHRITMRGWVLYTTDEDPVDFGLFVDARYWHYDHLIGTGETGYMSFYMRVVASRDSGPWISNNFPHDEPGYPEAMSVGLMGLHVTAHSVLMP